MKGCVLALALLLVSRAALAEIPLIEQFLVESQDGQPADLKTVFLTSKHDLPGLTGPDTGFEVSHSALWPDTSSYILQTFSAPPFKSFVPSMGDGGQFIYYDGQVATAVSTRDGGTSGNQYFAPAGCPVGGWLLFRINNIPQGSWASETTTLVNVPEPTGNCPAPAVAFTQWRIEYARMYFLIYGKPSWMPVWTIVSEHYAGASIAGSKTMERFYFVYGYGWVRWEAWTTNTLAAQDADLLGRCPGVYVKGWKWPIAEPGEGWIQTACRSWTNLITDGDGKTTIGDISWSP